MSWQSVVTGRAVQVRASELESRRFGRTFSRIEVPIGVEDPSALDDVRAALRESPADIVVLRYPAARVDWFARLLGPDRDLITADALAYWRLVPGRGRRPNVDPDVTVTPAGTLDGSLVDEVVRDVFAGYGNHYLANPLLSRDDALAGYVEWAQHSVGQDTAIVLRTAVEGIVGLATLAHVGETCEIELAGIRQRFQRRGLYAHLLAGCETTAAGLGASDLVISTQVHNANVQRAWARYGFEPVGALLTVHAVRRGLLPSA